MGSNIYKIFGRAYREESEELKEVGIVSHDQTPFRESLLFFRKLWLSNCFPPSYTLCIAGRRIPLCARFQRL